LRQSDTNYYFCLMNLKQFFEKGDDYFLPNLSIDMVIIGYSDHQLKCLLLRIGDKWMVPGGHIKRDESVNDAAKRILKIRTNLEKPYLKFLSVFGEKDRMFSTELKEYFEKIGLPWKEEYWINARFVTLAYYSLVNMDNTHPALGEFDEEISWFNMNDLPDMWMDHKSIVLEAREKLKEDIKHEHMTYNLLPKEFTMPELHQLHQTILEEKLDRSRFQKRMLSSGIFERLPKLQKETPGSNPFQYRVKI
jgi:8-oxo-dGTP diphosphatase